MSRVPASRERRLVRAGTGLAVAAILAADVIGIVRFHPRPGAAPAPSGPSAAASRHPPGVAVTATPGAGIPPGQDVIDGTVDSLSAAQATGPALDTPLLVAVPVRGRGSAYLYNLTVGHRPDTTIYWNAGQPLSLVGDGALIPGRVNVTVDARGSTWYLDGAERRLAPGAYEAATPVAVGTSGLATPEPASDFTAGAQSVMVTAGGATVHRPPSALNLVGPGALQMIGRLRVATDAGVTEASRLTLPAGSYLVDLTPGPSGLSIHATVQGRLDATA